jgi:hypothetical protein
LPRRYKFKSYRPTPRWTDIWHNFYVELEKQGVPILQAAGYYQAHDVEASGNGKLGEEERVALERVATALTIAADGAHQTSGGMVAAWLDKIRRKPAVYRTEVLPPEVFEAIAAHYRRGTEPPRTHMQDVFGGRRIRFPGKKRRPTPKNIARAAHAAFVSLHRHRGRPQNIANLRAAEYLSSAYRFLSGRRIVRRRMPILRRSGVAYVEDGPFNRFLKRVIGPLQKHLKAHGLQPVTIDTIERISIEEFQY